MNEKMSDLLNWSRYILKRILGYIRVYQGKNAYIYIYKGFNEFFNSLFNLIEPFKTG